MKPVFHLKVPTAGFTFKPATIKQKHISSTHKPLTKILYCIASKTEDGKWEAIVNTKGIEGYKDATVLPFTDKSFELKGRVDVFYHEKDKYGHWVRVIRTIPQSEESPGNSETYCTLCDNCVFTGHIVNVNGVKMFDMSVYKGTYKECQILLTTSNKKNKDE